MPHLELLRNIPSSAIIKLKSFYLPDKFSLVIKQKADA